MGFYATTARYAQNFRFPTRNEHIDTEMRRQRFHFGVGNHDDSNKADCGTESRQAVQASLFWQRDRKAAQVARYLVGSAG